MSEPITSEEYWAEVDRKLAARAEEFVPKHKPWTPQESALVARWYKKVKLEDLAEMLGRSLHSIRNHYSELRHGEPRAAREE